MRRLAKTIAGQFSTITHLRGSTHPTKQNHSLSTPTT